MKNSFYKNFLYHFVFIGLLHFSILQSVHAKDAISNSEHEKQVLQLIKTLVVYQKAPTVYTKTEKTIESELLEKTTVYEGELYLGQGRFRWETSKPEQSLVLFDGKELYSIQDKQVVRSKMTKQIKQQSLMSVLFSPKSLKERFVVKALQGDPQDSQKLRFSLQAKTKDVELSDLEVTLAGKAKLIERISYRDEIGNKVQINFLTTELRKSRDNERFSYQIKQGEKIIDL